MKTSPLSELDRRLYLNVEFQKLEFQIFDCPPITPIDSLQNGGEAYYEIYLNLGSALYQQKKYTEAALCYEVVLQEEPLNKVARDRQATLNRFY